MNDLRSKYCSKEDMLNISEYVTCPKCGGGIGLWTDSILTICWFCGYHVFKNEAIIN